MRVRLRRLLGLLVPLLVLALGGGPCVPGASGREDGLTRLPPGHPVPDETDWYGLYDGETKVGWARLELRLVGSGDEAVYVSLSEIHARFRGLTGEGVLDFEARDEFDAREPFGIRSSREVRREGDRHRSVTLEREGDSLVGHVTSESGVEGIRLPAADYTLADRLTHVNWMRTRPEVGSRIRVAELDLSELKPAIYSYRVESWTERILEGAPAHLAEVRMESDARGLLGTALIDSAGRMLRGPVAGRLEMRIETEAHAKVARHQARLFAWGRAPVTEPLGDPALVTRLEVDVYGRGAATIPGWAGQETSALEDGLSLVVQPASTPADEASRVGSLADEARYRIEDAAWLDAARRIREEHAEPEAIVVRLLDMVAARLADALWLEEGDLSRVVAEGGGDATEHARLFVALARAVGIPAREVHGLRYLGDDENAFAGHAWCEVVLDGAWVAVDPTWNQMPVDATHVGLVRGPTNRTAMLERTRHWTFEIRSVTTR